MPIAQITFLDKLLRRTARAAIGPSALRNQGAGGVIAGAGLAVEEIDLHRYGLSNGNTLQALLDEGTQALLKKFPQEAQSWGAARKGLNLFLRDATYNIDLSAAFGLARIRPFLEVPLDRDIGSALSAQPEGANLPKWDTIKGLTPTISHEYQSVATEVAKRYKVHRVDLDVFFWGQ